MSNALPSPQSVRNFKRIEIYFFMEMYLLIASLRVIGKIILDKGYIYFIPYVLKLLLFKKYKNIYFPVTRI